MTPEDMKKWIDAASYEDLLFKWRFARPGDPFFQGDIGQYYKTELTKKRDAVGPGEAVRASKSVGWDPRGT